MNEILYKFLELDRKVFQTTDRITRTQPSQKVLSFETKRSSTSAG